MYSFELRAPHARGGAAVAEVQVSAGKVPEEAKAAAAQPAANDKAVWRDWRRSYNCAVPGACIVDSGNPALELPAEVHDQLVALGDDLINATLSLHLADGGTLALPGRFLRRQLELGYLSRGAGVVLGLPLSELFYIIFGALNHTLHRVLHHALQHTSHRALPPSELFWTVFGGGVQWAMYACVGSLTRHVRIAISWWIAVHHAARSLGTACEASPAVTWRYIPLRSVATACEASPASFVAFPRLIHTHSLRCWADDDADTVTFVELAERNF